MPDRQHPGAPGTDAGTGPAPLPGPVTGQQAPQAVYAGESLTQTLRQLDAYGRDGLPVLSADRTQVLGWITNASVLHAVAAEIGGSPPQATPAPPGPGPAPGAGPPTPLPGYRVIEITVGADSAAVGTALGAITWPHGYVPVSVLRHRSLDEPDPALTLAPGDRISLLAPAETAPAPPTETRERGPRPGRQSGTSTRVCQDTAPAPGAQP